MIGCKLIFLMCRCARLSCIWPPIFLSEAIQNALRTSAIWKGLAGSGSGGGPRSKGWGWLEGLHLTLTMIHFTLYSDAAEVRPPSTERAFAKMVPGNLPFCFQNDYVKQVNSISKHLMVDYYRGLFNQMHWHYWGIVTIHHGKSYLSTSVKERPRVLITT